MSRENEGAGTVVDEGTPAPSVDCLNCGNPLVGEYCHHCGQAAHVHRSLSAFWHDVAHSLMHFEGKVWRTLPMLAWRPGDLTRRYIQGERARFVSPVALFLFSVLLMFAVISATGGPVDFATPNPGLVADAMATERGKAAVRLVELERQRGELMAARKSTAVVDAAIKQARDDIESIDMFIGSGSTIGDRMAASRLRLTSNEPWTEQALRKAMENPSLLIYKLQTNAYKFSWALIPISVPFVWLLLPFRRQFGAYDHAVFVTYSITFVTLLVVLLSIGRAIGLPEAVIVLSLGLVPPVHMYRQLKGAYGLSRFGAIWRAFLLACFAVIALVLFFILLVFIGVV